MTLIFRQYFDEYLVTVSPPFFAMVNILKMVTFAFYHTFVTNSCKTYQPPPFCPASPLNNKMSHFLGSRIFFDGLQVCFLCDFFWRVSVILQKNIWKRFDRFVLDDYFFSSICGADKKGRYRNFNVWLSRQKTFFLSLFRQPKPSEYNS